MVCSSRDPHHDTRHGICVDIVGVLPRSELKAIALYIYPWYLLHSIRCTHAIFDAIVSIS